MNTESYKLPDLDQKAQIYLQLYVLFTKYQTIKSEIKSRISAYVWKYHILKE